MTRPISIVRGFSLVECVIALGIICSALIPMLGLLPIGLNSMRNSSSQTCAINLITSIATDLRASAGIISPHYSLSTTSLGDQILFLDESGAKKDANEATFKVVIQRASGQSTAVLHRVTITWPAQASQDKALGIVEFLIAANGS